MSARSAARRSRAVRFTAWFGSASLAAIAAALPAAAQMPAPVAQAGPETVPEQVLVTGSLIHGAAAVGVPVTSLGTEDFKQTGALTTADLFKTIPAAQVAAFQSATDAGANIERGQNVNLRGLSTKGARTLLLVDGYRFPGQGDGGCIVDPVDHPCACARPGRCAGRRRIGDLWLGRNRRRCEPDFAPRL